MSRLVLIHWKPEEAVPSAGALRRAGHDVRVLAPRGGVRDLRRLGEDPPDAVVIDLARLPSQGGAVGIALRQQKATRAVPLVFIKGDTEKTARVRQLLPDAVYADAKGLPAALRRAMARRARVPVVPDTMAGYSGTPLPKKLGIKPGSRVALIGAPPDFARTLGPLPGGATVSADARSSANVVLLFAWSRAELGRRFARAVKAMAEGGALWIVWPKKASGLARDLGEGEVRGHGLAARLVDYKIAAIDATWSGLCFARRKARG